MKGKGPNDRMAWVEIDKRALLDNIRALRSLARRRNGRAILPVIKANAYGHGMFTLADILRKEKVPMFAVSDVREGVLLREQGFQEEVLLLETPLPEQARRVVEYGLTPTVCSLELARALSAAACALRKEVPVHIKVDTGMGRLGIPYEAAVEFIGKVKAFSSLKAEGLYTHFPLADTSASFTRRQIEKMSALVARSRERGVAFRYVHAANSAGFAGFADDLFNLARPGLMLYGLYPNVFFRKKIRLRPVMTVKARVIFTKTIARGQGVSYGHTFVARRKMTVAVISIGYSDGYFRGLSNRSSVLIKGQFCPLLGRVTMDQIVVDVSKVKGVRAGEVAVVLGKQKGKEILADELARLAGTINYEITCNLGNRLASVGQDGQ